MATIAYAGVCRRAMGATPEIYFAKQIDNSRLVKVADPARSREMRMFVASLVMLFAMVMVYAWQHYSAIEYGYANEDMRIQRDALLETNRQLNLEEASLQQPERIDELARRMGLQTPTAGQVVRMEPADTNDSSMPVMARVAAVTVISAERQY
jgi:cell division protein FtsL